MFHRLLVVRDCSIGFVVVLLLWPSALTRAAVLTFSLTVTDTQNFASLPDTVVITMVPYRVLLPPIMKQ